MKERSQRLLVLEIYVLTWMIQSIVVPPTWPYLIGDRTNSMFDIWCLGHFMFGVIVTGLLKHIKAIRTSQGSLLNWVLGVLIVWEASELSIEMGSLGDGVQAWKHGFEHWSNRFVADPLIGLLGFAVYRRWPKIFFPVLVFGIVWEIAQISQPTSITIQDWLITYL